MCRQQLYGMRTSCNELCFGESGVWEKAERPQFSVFVQAGSRTHKFEVTSQQEGLEGRLLMTSSRIKAACPA